MKESESTNSYITLYIALLVPLGLAALVWAVYGFPVEYLSVGMIIVSVMTIFFGSSLRVNLPGTNIHLTASDAMIFLVILTFGGELAVLLGALEALTSSLLIRRKGIRMRIQTIMANMSIAVLSVFSSAIAVNAFFGRPESVVDSIGITQLSLIMVVMGLSQFVANSLLVSTYVSLRNREPIWSVWNEYCFSALVIYLTGALLGGLLTKALYHVDIYLFASMAIFFIVVYFTYVRYADAVRRSSAKAEKAERERAEQAEQHISELKHYIQQLEVSANALRESHEKLHHTVFHDTLTGLPNRNFFVEKINSLLAERVETRHNFAVIFLDLNRFKTINDSLGYTIGDELIRTVSARLSGSGIEGCDVGRFGGDEFALILPNIRTVSDAVELANWIAVQVALPYDLLGRHVFASASLGIAISDDRYNNAEELLRDADIAMYNAKETSKSYVIFDQIMHARAVSLLELETDLRLAVERNEFELFYQPIVNLGDATLVGFEALIRWNHPSRGLITPGEFIDTAESTGLMIPMTLTVMRTACQQMTRWKRARLAPRSLSMSVNFSASHLCQPDVVQKLNEIIEETGVDPSCLKLEITESAVMGNAEAAIDVLRNIQRLGVQISIDDFGTGYSNLSYLHRFPIDTLKVDRSFVSTMEEGTENGEIVRTVIALAKALRLSVIAEGIESIHQFHQLRILGCEFGQGYLFSRPIPVSEATKLLEDPGRWSNILPNTVVGVIARNLEYTHLRIQ
ncbi:MAG TPA: EAL domain-containing protein [Pyrinomonadaceae bacterium]|nr:EAL domain-containing protein [Pyrinomonadaceae bacterium]